MKRGKGLLFYYLPFIPLFLLHFYSFPLHRQPDGGDHFCVVQGTVRLENVLLVSKKVTVNR